MKYIRLGDLLVKSGTITQAQLDEALRLQENSEERLGTVLQKQGFITEKQLIDTLMSQLGVEFIDLNGCNIPSEMAQVLPKNIAKKHGVVPVRVTRSDVYAHIQIRGRLRQRGAGDGRCGGGEPKRRGGPDPAEL